MTGISSITSIHATEAYSDNGMPAIQVWVSTLSGSRASALCSFSPASGPYCLPTPLDADERFHGRGLRGAAEALNRIAAPALIGMDATDQMACDACIESLDTGVFGAVGSSALSFAILRAAAACLRKPLYECIPRIGTFMLPAPTHCAASGSVRYGGPVSAAGNPVYCFIAYDYPTFDEAAYELWELMMDWTALLSKKLSIRLSLDHSKSIPIGRIEDDFQLLDMMSELIAKRGQEGKIGIQADLAAHCFYDPIKGVYSGLLRPGTFSREDLIQLVEDMIRCYPFVVIEDPLCADDWAGFAYLTAHTGIQIVGDALFASDPQRFLLGSVRGAANTILISPGSAGTITRAAHLAQLATQRGCGVTLSSSCGEGTAICDFAAAWGCGAVSECGLSYTYNRFMEIESNLGRDVQFLGKHGLKGSKFQTDTHKREK